MLTIQVPKSDPAGMSADSFCFQFLLSLLRSKHADVYSRLIQNIELAAESVAVDAFAEVGIESLLKDFPDIRPTMHWQDRLNAASTKRGQGGKAKPRTVNARIAGNEKSASRAEVSTSASLDKSPLPTPDAKDVRNEKSESKAEASSSASLDKKALPFINAKVGGSEKRESGAKAPFNALSGTAEIKASGAQAVSSESVGVDGNASGSGSSDVNLTPMSAPTIS